MAPVFLTNRVLPAMMEIARKIATLSKGVVGGKILVKKHCLAKNALVFIRRRINAKRTDANSMEILNAAAVVGMME
jgi:hypothetical protein